MVVRHGSEDGEESRGLVECLPIVVQHVVGDDSSSLETPDDGRMELDCWEEVTSALSFALDLFAFERLDDAAVALEKRQEHAAVLDRIRRKVETLGSYHGEYDEQIEKEERNCGLVIEMGECDAEAQGPVGPFTLCGTNSFSSLRSNVSVPRHGKWMYEVHLRTSGIMQLGWVTPVTVYTSEDGVGDSRDSFAYDGKRKRKWNVASTEYGEQWTSGDVISCGIDFDRGVVEYWRNGVHLGVAYSPATMSKDDPQQLLYFPGVSLSYGESCEVNLGNIEFRYPVKGYLPVLQGHAARRQVEQERAKYLMDSLERLVIIGESKHRAVSPRAAAAIAAAHAVEYFGLDDDDDAEKTESVTRQSVASDAFESAQELAARVLFDSLGEVLMDEGIVDSVFLHSCRRMKTYDHTGSALTRFLELLAKYLPERICQRLVQNMCVCCGRRVRGCVWTREDDPESCDAVVYPILWHHIMKNDILAGYWIAGSDWRLDFEDFFFVRQPTAADLEDLIPSSLDDDIENVLDRVLGVHEDESDSSLLSVVTELVCFLNRVDDIHCLLLQQLMDIPDATNDGLQASLDSAQVDDFLSAFEANQVTQAPRDTWTKLVMDVMEFNQSTAYEEIPSHLCSFMSHIIHKNLQANREVPPPDLSHPSVICSLLSFMTRASRKYLRKVHLEGSGFEYPRQAFLRGIRSTVLGVNGESDDDNLAPDERMGGGLSFLCKSSIVEACNRSKTQIQVPSVPLQEEGNDWAIPVDLRPATVFIEDDAPKWSWWILDSCFILFHLGAGQVLKKINTFMQTFEAAVSSFKTMVEKFSKEDVDQDFVEMSLQECKKAMMHSLRMLMWHLNWLMPKWKQQTFGALASTMSRVLLEIQKDENAPDLSYVADFYVENILEMILACRGPDVSWPMFDGNLKVLFEPVLKLCIQLIRDQRVLHPRVQNSVLYSIWIMLRDEDTCFFITQSEFARLNLLPCLIESFSHSRNWIHASNAFGLLVQNSGLSPRIGSEEDSKNLTAYRATIRSWLKDILMENPALSNSMFNGLIDRLNWISPELVIIIKDLHHQICGSGSRNDYSLNYRRALAACDLLYHLLRLLELTCASNPDAVLSKEPHAELISTRLAEHISWGLLNFSKKSHVYKLIEDIHKQDRSETVQIGRDARPTMIAEILGPYIGILVSLSMGANDVSESSEFKSFVEQVYENGALSDGAIQACLETITNPAASGLQRPTELQMEHIVSIIDLVENISEKDRANHDAAALSDRPSVPEEFLDPILNVLMKDPVILPDSKVTLDRKTIQRHLTVSSTDPFSRCQLKEEDLIPNGDLKKKVEEWLTLNSLTHDDAP